MSTPRHIACLLAMACLSGCTQRTTAPLRPASVVYDTQLSSTVVNDTTIVSIRVRNTGQQSAYCTRVWWARQAFPTSPPDILGGRTATCLVISAAYIPDPNQPFKPDSIRWESAPCPP